MPEGESEKNFKTKKGWKHGGAVLRRRPEGRGRRMRVISQKQDYSVDFERTPFWRQENYIYAMVGGQRIVFGNYKTDEDASKMLGNLHKEYIRAGNEKTVFTL